MACTPGNSCCCCVPCCLGLRAGVLILAILQILGGSLSAIATTAVLISGAMGEEQQHLEFYAQYGLYLGWNLIIFTTGIIGVRATSNLEMVRNVEAAIVRRAKTYWRISVFVQVVFFIASLASAVLQTLYVAANPESFTPQERTLSICLFWLACLIGVSIQAYFLWVVWSYKARVNALRRALSTGPTS